MSTTITTTISQVPTFSTRLYIDTAAKKEKKTETNCSASNEGNNNFGIPINYLDELCLFLWYIIMQAVNNNAETNMQVVNCIVVRLQLRKTGYIAVSLINRESREKIVS